MDTNSRDIAVERIVELPKEKVIKVLVFMRELEKVYNIDNISKSKTLMTNS